MRKMLVAALCVILLLLPVYALASVAYPGGTGFTEAATGKTLRIYNRGDEYFSYMTDMDGRLLVVDAMGYLRWVELDAQKYVLGKYATGDAPSDGSEVRGDDVSQALLQALRDEIAGETPKLFASGQRISDIDEDYDFAGDAAKGRAQVCDDDEDRWIDDISNYPEKEEKCALLVLRVQFEDLSGVFSDAAWHKRIFEDGVSTYYSTVSNGKFTYVPVKESAGEANDGVVTVTLPFNAPPYVIPGEGNQNVQADPEAGLYRGSDGQNYAIYNMGSIFAYALLLAEDSIDFAAYDRNDDGYISPTELAVLVVYTGYEAGFSGRDAIAGMSAVWAHSWKYNNLLRGMASEKQHYMSISVDKKKLYKYTVIGELACTPDEYDIYSREGTPRQAQFGTATHELGHDLGLTDLYATDGASTTENIDALSLMAIGSWGFEDGAEPGSSPTHLDPYSKIFLGFYTAETAADEGRYTLYASEPSSRYNILRIDTDNPDVYYLLENRQNVGFDRGLQYMYYEEEIGGIVVWRIDEAVLRKGWWNNTANNMDGNYGNMPIFSEFEWGGRQPFWSKRISLNQFETLQKLLPVQYVSEIGAAMTVELGTVEAPIRISRQPADVYAAVGQRAEFSTAAQGENLSYEWQFCAPGGYEWVTIPGAQGASLLTAEVTPEDDGMRYRCLIRNERAYITTREVVLHVSEAPVPPKTGDDSRPLLWLGILLLGGLGLARALWKRRRG